MRDLSNLVKIQNELRSKISLKKLDKEIKFIAGCDSSIINPVRWNPGKEELIFSIFVTFSFPELEILEVVHHKSKMLMPYVPGFLSFREIPNLLKAYNKLNQKPDLIIVDGNGIIHPRNMGIATNLGIELNIPTLGIAKSLLYGSYKIPELLKGSNSSVVDKKGKQLGYALRTKNNVKPVFVSPGNLISMEDSLEITLQCLKNYRLPEPTRIADKLSKELKNL